MQSENGTLPTQLCHKQRKLKLKSRIKLNHNTFKVITELLKSGTSVKKWKTKQIIICNNNFKAQDKSFEKSHLPTFYTYMSITPYTLIRCNNFILAKGRYQ